MLRLLKEIAVSGSEIQAEIGMKDNQANNSIKQSSIKNYGAENELTIVQREFELFKEIAQLRTWIKTLGKRFDLDIFFLNSSTFL